MKYFTSDFHIGHTKVIQFSKRPFSSVQEMDDTIIKNVISILKPKDELYFLGDFSWSLSSSQKFFSQLPYDVDFYYILGNHENGHERFKSRCKVISPLYEIVIAGNITTLCHYPMITWNKSHYNSWHLFGHHHNNSNGTDKLSSLVHGKALNVNIEFHDYKPWSEDEIVAYMSKRPDNWDLIRRE